MKQCLILLLFLSQATFAQNLVPNPSFEKISFVPNNWMANDATFENCMKEWNSPTQGSPDVHVTATLGKFRFKRPLVFPQNHHPRSGNTMVALKTYGCGSRTLHCKEYLQVQLKEPLVKGKEYYLEFWISALQSGVKVNNFGASLSDVSIKEPMEIGLFYFEPVVLDSQIIDVPPKQWVRIAGTFKADFSYEYLIIGNFFADDLTKSKAEDPGIKYSYYFFDDVLLKPLFENPPRSLNESDLEVGATIALRDIYFEFDKTQLLPKSYVQLNKLLDILQKKPSLQIRISGHTDNIGDASYNQELSQARAQAVVDYLLEKGIKTERLSASGFGQSLPIADNNTEEGRQLNRRVELTVVSATE